MSKEFKSNELRVGLRAMMGDEKVDQGKQLPEVMLLIQCKVRADMERIYCQKRVAGPSTQLALKD